MCMCGNLSYFIFISLMKYDGLPGGTVVKKNLSASAGSARDSSSIPGLGRSQE